MLKEQMLKKYKAIGPKWCYTKQYNLVISALIIATCILIAIIALKVDHAVKFAAMDNKSLSSLVNMDLDTYQTYKGSTAKAVECLDKARFFLFPFIFCVTCLCLIPLTKRKQKEILALIEQLPDEV